MCRRLSAIRSHRLLWLAFSLFLAAAGFTIAYASVSWAVAPHRPAGGRPPEDRIPQRLAARAPAIPPRAPGPAASPTASDTAPSDTAPSDTTSRVAATAAQDDFVRRIDVLAGLAARTAELCAAERIDAAAELDRESTARFAELMACHPDAGERAVAALDGAGSNAHRLVLELVLEAECSRRSRTDALVGEVLAAVLRGGALADTGEFLIDGPWLRAPHEPAVLTIAAAAEAGEVPGAIATGLLRTLWDNIEQDGERPDPVRDDLAMQWLADGNRCQRAVAVRHLLRAGGRRGMVLSWLRRSGSPGLTAEITRQVARDLSPREAVAILRELSSAAPSLAGACMVLAARAPEAVIDGYYECLASDTHPAARRDLIAGLAMAAATDECRAALELANVADSAAEVRVQAMLSLSATAPEQAEAACWRVLAHPETAADPKALAVVVFAVQNLEAAGLVNAVDRLGTRLRSRALSRSSRELLERVLRQGVPPRLPATAPPAGRR